MPAIRGITVSVGYAELLRVTLARNLRHLTECVVVTSPEDHATQEVARSVPDVRVFVTDAFTRPDARGVRPFFNKGLALEEGFSFLGRHGWILVHDADIILPDSLPLANLDPTRLYGARRRILEDPAKWSPDLDWMLCPLSRDGGPVGFFQLFAADDPTLRKRPWYDVSFSHAGGGDAYFLEHWPPTKRTILPVDVLHLGPRDTHWFGTDDTARDLMAKFVTENGWARAARKFTPEQVARAGELVERVEVPGYPKSNYDLPFVRREQARRANLPQV